MRDLVDIAGDSLSWVGNAYENEKPQGHLLSEKELHAAADGNLKMTPEEKEWCLDEIGKVEGYERKDYESESDSSIAQGVLSAWLDYCRDKGLL